MAKKKVEIENPFEKELAECVVVVSDTVNGRTASTTFHNKKYSSTAPSDMMKRQQKPTAIKNLLNLIRKDYGVETN